LEGHYEGKSQYDYQKQYEESFLFMKLVFYILCLTILVGCTSEQDISKVKDDFDICIYGGTSGGAIAAIAAAECGKRVALVEPGMHIGGMTSGGIGIADTGFLGAIGGLAWRFYREIGYQYGTGSKFEYEPHVAEGVFKKMLAETNAIVNYSCQLVGLTKENGRIKEIRMANGRVFKAKVFIDATYEGDLLAMAGVSYVVGREGLDKYGESLNGALPSTSKIKVDPFIVPGDKKSGMLPFIQEDAPDARNEGDHRLQAYTFRLCLTKEANNRIPIDPPSGYDPARYELIARIIDSKVAANIPLGLKDFLYFGDLPNGKVDCNSYGFISTDYVGMNYGFPEASYEDRKKIIDDHENYIRGVLTFLATSPRVPNTVRQEMGNWGLCKDEFQETGGWPFQLYIREARRMVSDYVISQSDCLDQLDVPDSIGLASYSMDAHSSSRTTDGNIVSNEGDIHHAITKPYRIPYRSIVPSESECSNLLVTFCLSASHVAFSSIRMEPVLMVTSQSAAVAASLAIDSGVSVQNVDYQKLRERLVEAWQILEWNQ
jgi:hypothetical protein